MPATRPRAYQIYDIDWKQSVRVVSTSNTNLALGAAYVIDSVPLNPFDRVLLTAQTSAQQNGIYQVTAMGTALERAIDFQNSPTGSQPTVSSGLTVTVDEGQYYTDSIWVLATDDPILVGTTPLLFVQQNNYVGANGSIQFNVQPGNRKGSSDNFIFNTSNNTVIVDGNVEVSGNISGTFRGNIIGDFYGNAYVSNLQPWLDNALSNNAVDAGSPTSQFRRMYAGEFITPAGAVGNPTQITPNPSAGASGIVLSDAVTGTPAGLTAGDMFAGELSVSTRIQGGLSVTAPDVVATNILRASDITSPGYVQGDRFFANSYIIGPRIIANANVVGQWVTGANTVNGNYLVANIAVSAPAILANSVIAPNVTVSDTLRAQQIFSNTSITAADFVIAPIVSANTVNTEDLNVTDAATVGTLFTDNIRYANGTFRNIVESISAGPGIQLGPNPIIKTGTVSLATSGVTAGSYGTATRAAGFTVDIYGRLLQANTTLITPAFSSITDTPTTLAGYGITDAVNNNRVAAPQVGGIPGVASLDITGKVPVEQLPSIAISNTFVVNTYQDLTTLTTAELGDVAIVVDDPDIYHITTANADAGVFTMTFNSVANVEPNQSVLRLANGVQIFNYGTVVESVDVGNSTVTFTQALTTFVGSGANLDFSSLYNDTSWILSNAAPNAYANLNNWVQLRFPTPVVSVNGKTGAVVLNPNDIGAAANTITITAGYGLEGGGNLQQNRTIAMANSGVAPGIYGNTSYVPVITVDRTGRIANVELAPVDQTLSIVYSIALG